MLNNILSRSMSKLWLSSAHVAIEGVCLSMPYISKQDNTLLTKGKGRVVKTECLHSLYQKAMSLFCLYFKLTRSFVCVCVWLWSVWC